MAPAARHTKSAECALTMSAVLVMGMSSALSSPSPRTSRGEHLCFQSSTFFGPEAIVVNEGIGEHDELSGDRREGLLGGLCLLVPEPSVEGPEVWVAAYGRDGRQVEGRSDMLASAADAAPALALARVAGDRG